jgi:hypothetical protein
MVKIGYRYSTQRSDQISVKISENRIFSFWGIFQSAYSGNEKTDSAVFIVNYKLT